MTTTTPEQELEVKRLVAEEGLDEEKARQLVTEPLLDLPVGADGEPLVPAPPQF